MNASILDVGQTMDILLNALAEGHSLKEAALKAQCSPAAHYHWLKTDRAYQEGYKLAVTMRTRLLEDTLLKRAIDGFDEIQTTYSVTPDGREIPVEKKVTRKIDNRLAGQMLAANNDQYNLKIKPAEIASKTSVAEVLAAARRRLAAQGENASEENED